MCYSVVNICTTFFGGVGGRRDVETQIDVRKLTSHIFHAPESAISPRILEFVAQRTLGNPLVIHAVVQRA